MIYLPALPYVLHSAVAVECSWPLKAASQELTAALDHCSRGVQIWLILPFGTLLGQWYIPGPELIAFLDCHSRGTKMIAEADCF